MCIAERMASKIPQSPNRTICHATGVRAPFSRNILLLPVAGQCDSGAAALRGKME